MLWEKHKLVLLMMRIKDVCMLSEITNVWIVYDITLGFDMFDCSCVIEFVSRLVFFDAC